MAFSRLLQYLIFIPRALFRLIGRSLRSAERDALPPQDASLPKLEWLGKSEQIRTLEVMPREVKILYTRILAAQALADGQFHPAEFSDLYVFMTQIGLDADARNEVRAACLKEHINLLDLVTQVLEHVTPDERPVLKFSLVKDLIRVARMDGELADEETQNIRLVAEHLYSSPDKATQIINFAEKAILYDEKLLQGKLSVEEFTQGARNLAATATSIGVPITAVYFSGSVVGLSAAGIISGLAELGLGGILGFSSLVTGIGMVVVMGIVTYKLVRWAINSGERKMANMREHIIQEVITLNQQAMLALAEDMNGLAAQMEHLAAASDQNRARLERLTQLYRHAAGILQDREDQYIES